MKSCFCTSLVDWLDSLGVRGVELDLPGRSDEDYDWEANLEAVRRVIAALAAEEPPGMDADPATGPR